MRYCGRNTDGPIIDTAPATIMLSYAMGNGGLVDAIAQITHWGFMCICRKPPQSRRTT